ncbi:hypothetical protein BHE74_00002180 [Ensete ventricosum]|nr:hypothetical protein BHE74_00002180 [Ensete ventricosum]
MAREKGGGLWGPTCIGEAATLSPHWLRAACRGRLPHLCLPRRTERMPNFSSSLNYHDMSSCHSDDMASSVVRGWGYDTGLARDDCSIACHTFASLLPQTRRPTYPPIYVKPTPRPFLSEGLIGVNVEVVCFQVVVVVDVVLLVWVCSLLRCFRREREESWVVTFRRSGRYRWRVEVVAVAAKKANGKEKRSFCSFRPLRRHFSASVAFPCNPSRHPIRVSRRYLFFHQSLREHHLSIQIMVLFYFIEAVKCKIGTEEQNEWYFFSHKDKKYPTGTRTNRATTAGFWKATGRDKPIYSKNSLIGMRKTLVFYRGRAPNGQKSDWIMHEYRLETNENAPPQASSS